MRKLVFAINMSADGYCDHTFAAPDDELMEYFVDQMKEAETLLYGRTTYEMMFPYWAEVAEANADTKANIDFAKAINAVPNIVVFSTTLYPANVGRAKVVRGHVRDEITKLKQQGRGVISTGGITFPSELLSLGLIDEIRLVVHPVIVGKGRRLFDQAQLPEHFAMKLEGTRTFKSGVIELRYEKALQS